MYYFHTYFDAIVSQPVRSGQFTVVDTSNQKIDLKTIYKIINLKKE